jgi:arylsulfatase A-like enzyme
LHRPPNLLLIITDQQRADTLAPGHSTATPHLRALAAEGVRFERAYAVNPICSPSRASLFTGLLPHAHGITDVTHATPATQADLTPGTPFWSRMLQHAGFETAYFGKWHVERSDRLADFGFDESATELRLAGLTTRSDALDPRIDVQHDGYRPFLLAGVTDAPAAELPERALFDRAIEFVTRPRDAARPWALCVATEAPHDPYVAPRDLFERALATATPSESADDDLTGRPAIYRRIRATWEALTPEEARVATACYQALCAALDDEVGRLMAALAASGQADDTLVVFTSDHGDYLGAHGLWLKGIPAFEEAYRVPLVLRGPGVPEGAVIPAPVSLLDLPRTLTQLLLGEDYPCHGRDLRQHWGAAANDGPLAHVGAYAEFHGQRFRATQRIVWQGDLKYVFNGFAEDELYDLARDPHERVNRATDPAYAPAARSLAAAMWRAARATDDATLADAEYGMFRFAPVGPHALEEQP